MKRHIQNTRDSLTGLHGLATETEAAERRILERAEARLEEVNGMIDRQRPGLDAAPDNAQDRYLSLIKERGQLQVVIAKSRAAFSI